MDRSRAHILVIPCMIQSHINPILQFSKRLASKNQIVTLIIPSSSTERFTIDVPSSCNIRVEYISNGSEEGESLEASGLKNHNTRPAITKGLSQLIIKHLQSDVPPKVLVYDVGFPWALDIAIEHGLHGAIFITNSCAVNAAYCAVRQSGRQIPWRGSVDSIPSFPVLEESDLPTMVTSDSHLYPELMKLVLDHFSSVQKAKYHLYSSFMELEEAVRALQNNMVNHTDYIL